MPLWPCSVVISANRKTTSVMGFWRPVNTLASLIGVASSRVMGESFTGWSGRWWRSCSQGLCGRTSPRGPVPCW